MTNNPTERQNVNLQFFLQFISRTLLNMLKTSFLATAGRDARKENPKKVELFV